MHKLQTMLRANENVQKINEARQAEQQQVPVCEPIEGDEGPQVAGEASSAMHDVADLQHSDNSGPSLDELASLLNADQTRLFDKIKCQLQYKFSTRLAVVSAVISNHCICSSVVWEERENRSS